MPKSIRIRYIMAALLWSAFLFGAGWLGHSALNALALKPGPATPATSTNPLLDEVWAHVREGFVGDVPSDTVRNYGAIRGALATLNDRWTVLIEPQPRSIERDHIRGEFGGIGVNLAYNAEGKVVVTPMQDSPAQQAGIQAGDILASIDDWRVADKADFNEIATRVRGDVGTPVRIAVLRGGKRIEFSVKRANIEVPSVTWSVITSTLTSDAHADSTAIGYIAIHQFTERTGAEVKQAIGELRQSGSQAYLIDLRDNGGGLLNAAVDVASQFIKDGVVLIEHRHDQTEVSFPTSGDGLATSEPLAVLINGNTASASEIVAGAIQDAQRGKLIGDKSFGKGSVQSIYDLSDGSSVHITSAKWLTPLKRTIDGQGLTPDVAVARAAGEGQQGKDSQLARAVSELDSVLARKQ